jgi:hypothetical protein
MCGECVLNILFVTDATIHVGRAVVDTSNVKSSPYQLEDVYQNSKIYIDRSNGIHTSPSLTELATHLLDIFTIIRHELYRVFRFHNCSKYLKLS